MTLKLKFQILSGLLLAGFFVYKVYAGIFIPFLASLLLHVAAGFIIFETDAVDSNQAASSSSPAMKVKLEPISESDKLVRESSGNPSTTTRQYTVTATDNYPLTLTGQTGTFTNCDDIMQTSPTTGGAEYLGPDYFWCYAGTKYASGPLAAPVTSCDSGLVDAGDGTCIYPQQPSDSVPSYVRNPDGVIVPDVSDPDTDTSAVTCSGNTCTASSPAASGTGTTTATLESSPDGSTITNVSTNQSLVKPDGSLDTNSTITTVSGYDNNGNLTSTSTTINWSDGTSSTSESTDSGTTNTGFGTTKIDETGTPTDTTSYANGDFSALDSFSSGLDSPQDTSTILQPSHTLSLGGLSSCNNANYDITYMGMSSNFNICEYIGYIQEILYYLFSLLTFAYIYNSYTSLNRG